MIKVPKNCAIFVFLFESVMVNHFVFGTLERLVQQKGLFKSSPLVEKPCASSQLLHFYLRLLFCILAVNRKK